MSLFGKVFGKPAGGDAEEDDSEVERLLQQIADARHAGDRRDAMSQLSSLLQDNIRAQYAISSMGLPVLLSVLTEDRDDLELLKGALEVLHLSVALPEGADSKQLEQQGAAPPPALINADMICRAPDNVLLLLVLLRPEPEGCEDFYVRYGALQALNGLLKACPDKLQACVLSSPMGVIALMDLLSQPLEVLRNEALLLLVGLCNGCPQIANIAAFEGAFEKLLAICGAEGGPAAGDVIVQDAAELMNNLLRDNLANQRLFREMGHIGQLPALLQFTPPAQPPPSAAAGIFSSASQYMDPSLRAAAGAAANAAANSAVGAAAAAAVAAAGAAAAAWPVQVAANYLCLLETARVLLAAPHSSTDDQRAQEDANRRANRDRLGQLGLMPLLVALSIPGAPSAAVRAQALFCLGDLVWGHAQLQEHLAGQLAAPPMPAGQVGFAGRAQQQPHPIPYLQAVLQVLLHGSDDLERAGASHVLAAFCHDNNLGQMAVLSTVVHAAVPQSFGEELLAALLCQVHPAAGSTPSPTKASQVASGQPGNNLQLQQQLTAGRAAMALSFLLQSNPMGQLQLLSLQVPAGEGGPAGGIEPLIPRVVKLLHDAARRADGKALPLCYSLLRLLGTWCSGCTAAVSALLANTSHLPLLVDMVGGRAAAGDAHTAGLAAVLLGVCLINAPGSPMSAQQQQQQGQQLLPPPGAAGGLNFDQLLDVLLSRVGLSQFFGAIDEMKATPAYQAAKAAPRLPAHITRGMAAALLESEASGLASAAAAAAAAAGGRAGPGAGLVGGALGLLSTAADAAGGSGSVAAAAHHTSEVQPYDQVFTKHAEEVAAAVQQLTLNAFSAGGSATTPTPSPGLAPKHLQQGALPIPAASPPAFAPPGVLPTAPDAASLTPPAGLPVHQPLLQPPPQQPLQQHNPLLPPPPQMQPAPQGTPVLPSSHPQPLQLPEGPLGAVAAQLQGDTAEQKLLAALDAILQLQGQVEELRSRNRSLAEDLIRVSQSKPGLAGAAGGPAANGGPTANGVHEGQEQSQAEVDARVVAQLRASRAEMEAGALRQQLSTMQERWNALEADATAAREAAEEARAAAGKAEADLAALSTAYNDLEAHAFRLEEQQKQLEQSDLQQQQQAAGLSDAEVEARIKAAVEQDRQQRQPSEPASGSSPDVAGGGVDVDARIAAAVSAAKAEAEAEAEEEMEDLLACLGEEQAKVEVLSGRLTELGQDVDALLASVAAKEDEEGAEELL